MERYVRDIVDVDLQNVSISELRQINNPVLRDALLAAKEQLTQELNSSYISHSQHTSHSNTG